MASYTTRHTARRCMKSITSPRQQGRLPSFDDRIDKITLKLDIEIIEIQKESEADVLSEFMKELQESILILFSQAMGRMMH
jgi:hypothetical protein